MDKKFSHLHLHTDYSLLDGLGKVEDYVKCGKELGMEAMAFTDHGTMAGLVTAYDACKANGMKFIGGFEAYVAPDGTDRFQKDFKRGESVYDHLIILFKDEKGYKNGCKLVTRSNTEGFYYKPRIDFGLLKECHEGLVILSACIAGAVPKAIIAGDMEKARRIASQYKEVFGDDYYLEIQNHGMKEEQAANMGLMQLSEELGIKLVATNDCHYVMKSDREAHDWLMCMQTDKKITDEDKMAYNGFFHLKSEEEMLEAFPWCKEAIYNTQEVVDKCNFEFDYGHYRMPKVHIPESYGDDYYSYMEDETWKGFEKRYPAPYAKREQAKKDVEYELSVIKQMGFADYFLDTRKTIMWAKGNGILVGPGRGSGAGSRVCYCLGITDIDPIQYNLLFERFLNPERVSMPDIDVDYSYNRKDEVIAFEAESNGKDHFAKIRTFGTMKAKAVVKGCAKVSGIDGHVQVGNKLAKYIGDCDTLKQAWDSTPELRMYVQSDPTMAKIWEISLQLEGTKKSASTHACGHIPTPVPCEELFPCGVDSETGYLVCEYDMTQAEHLGNLKKDLLMLRNLTIIDAAQASIKERTGKDIPLWTDEILNDKDALSLIASGETDGVFQLESDGMKKFMKQLQPDCFEDIIAGVALYRPGPMDYIPDYIKNKHNPSGIKYVTPELESILSPTYGIIVYQEQVMQIVQKLAGFSMGRADVVRKAMGKKKMDIMQEERQNFVYGNEGLNIEGCIKRGISEEIANSIYDQMIDFAKYAFNKSHAAAYAAISMQTAYLKAHYPHEFAAGLLTSVMGADKKLAEYLAMYRRSGIAVLPPDVNSSECDFSLEDGGIRFGLSAIKGIGEDAAKQVVANRKEKPYENYADVLERNLNLNKKVFEGLAKSGAMDSMEYNRATMLENIDPSIKRLKKAAKEKDENQLSLFDFFGMEDEAGPTLHIEEYEEMSLLERCSAEKEVFGFYLSEHPASYIEGTVKENGGIPISDITDEESDVSGIQAVGGIVTETKRCTTKKGNPMQIITVEDATGSLDILLFENSIEKFWYASEKGTLLFVRGKVKADGDHSSITANDIYVLHEHPSILWIATDNVTLTNVRKTATAFAKQNPGIEDYVYIASKTSRQKEVLPLKTALTPDVVRKAEIQFGKENVKVTQKKEKAA